MQNYIVQEQKIDAQGNVLGDAFPLTLTEAVFDGTTKEDLKTILNKKADKNEIPSDIVTTEQLNEVRTLAEDTDNNVTNLTGRVDTIDQEMLNKAEKSELPTKTSELTNDSGYAKMWFGTQSEYDAIQTKEPTTVYNIVEK